jgi:hypothetical protein
MKSRHHRVFRLLASTVTAAALAALVTSATGSSGGSVGARSPQHSNAILRNDIAHYGTHRRLSAPGASPVQRQLPAPIVVRVDGGFDWAAAGVGAAGALGLVLVAGSATSALRHHSKLTRRGPKAALTRGV